MKIHYNQWQTLCDVVFDGTLPDGNQTVYCPADELYDFFRLIEGTPNKYVLVSANSDYGITEQVKEPVNRDMAKYFNMIDVDGLGYNPILVPPRCEAGYCRITDKYSIKMYSWTKRTFDKIPDNIVTWFGTNLNIEDDRIIHIPFGIPDWTFDKVEKTIKTDFSIYINLQSNTLERVMIKNAFRGYPDVIIEDSVSHEDYVSRLKQCPFIFSLPGNGYDCFRTLEALYCGSMPVIVNDIWSQAYSEMPVIVVNNYHGMYEQLREIWEKSGGKMDLSIDVPALSLVEWANRIEEAKEFIT
jgi:hypothetical protein